MTQRSHLIGVCLLGCIIAALFGLVVAVRFDAAIPAFVSAALLPSAACYFAGVRDLRILARIALYAAIGWSITFPLDPQVAQVAGHYYSRVARAPLVGYEWYIACSCAASFKSSWPASRL